MSAAAILAGGVVCAVAGIGVLRLAWSRDRRSHPLNGSGWGLLGLGEALGGFAAGAWGASIVALWAMGAAFVALGAAALASRPTREPTRRASASTRRVGMMPEAGEPLRLGGRMLTFGLVAILPALLATGAGLAARGLARAGGAVAADANVLALFVMPLAWTGLAYALLMQPERRGQARILAIASLPTWPILIAGLVA